MLDVEFAALYMLTMVFLAAIYFGGIVMRNWLGKRRLIRILRQGNYDSYFNIKCQVNDGYLRVSWWLWRVGESSSYSIYWGGTYEEFRALLESCLVKPVEVECYKGPPGGWGLEMIQPRDKK